MFKIKKGWIAGVEIWLLLCIVLAGIVSPIDVDAAETKEDKAIVLDLEDGEYAIKVDLKGGSGKASVMSPTLMIVEDARAYARLVWSSSNYDYMIVDGITYWNLAEEEDANSVFLVPIMGMDEPVDVIGDTTAMGTPHEVAYKLTFYSDTIDSKSSLPQEEAKKVVMIALAIIIGGGILNVYVKKKLAA